mmetsp:Transcript_17461/g.27340  ORF Transcript_17461/g.27340 Transcript_17461/m.27340 type:complete len:279 (-) Transcript_17461:402-1238(-)
MNGTRMMRSTSRTNAASICWRRRFIPLYNHPDVRWVPTLQPPPRPVRPLILHCHVQIARVGTLTLIWRCALVVMHATILTRLRSRFSLVMIYTFLLMWTAVQTPSVNISPTSMIRRANVVLMFWTASTTQRCSRWDVRLTLPPHRRPLPPQRRPPQRRLPLLLQSLLLHCHVRIARVGVLKLISRRARTMAATMLTLEMPRLFIVWIRSWLVVRAVVWPAALRWALMIRRNNVVLIFWTASITQRCCRWDVRRPLRPRRRRTLLLYVRIARVGFQIKI